MLISLISAESIFREVFFYGAGAETPILATDVNVAQHISSQNAEHLEMLLDNH